MKMVLFFGLVSISLTVLFQNAFAGEFSNRCVDVLNARLTNITKGANKACQEAKSEFAVQCVDVITTRISFRFKNKGVTDESLRSAIKCNNSYSVQAVDLLFTYLSSVPSDDFVKIAAAANSEQSVRCIDRQVNIQGWVSLNSLRDCIQSVKTATESSAIQLENADFTSAE